MDNQIEKLSSLPSLRETVSKHSIQTKKELGQNFLFDLNITDKIARASGKLKDSTVIEIGPGPGGLTRSLLLNGAKKVIVIEKDERCLPILNEIKEIVGDRLDIINEDALKTKEEEFGSNLKIVANLPYNVATELLFKWLDKIEYFESFTLMFQKEVADRIAAKPRTKQYGRLSIVAQWLCEVQKEFDVPASAFYPPPKVTSTVITLRKRQESSYKADKKYLEKVVKAAFGQRRKMIRSSLKQITGNIDELLNGTNIREESRAEELDISQFCLLAERLKEIESRT